MSQAQIKQAIKKAKRLCQKAPRPFNTNAEIIETAKLLFTLRKSSEPEAARVERQFASMLHKCIALSSEKLQLMKVFSKHKFNRTEKEILLLFALSATGMHQPVEDLEDIQKAMNKSGKKVLSIAGSMTVNSRLCRSGMIEIYSNRGGTRFKASDEFISAILGKDCKAGWRVKKYDDLLDHTYKIVKAASR